MPELRLILYIIALELAAVATLTWATTTSLTVTAFATTHLFASLFTAQLVLRLLPEHYRRPPVPTLCFLTSFCFFIPLIAVTGLLISVLVARYFSKFVTDHPFLTVPMPHYRGTGRGAAAPRYSPGGITARLLHNTGNTDDRVRALLAVQAMPVRTSHHLLRRLLSDQTEDIRLIAYGMLDAQEKKINAEIHTQIGKLRGCEDAALRAILHKRLAELYWELVYQGLAQGDVMRYALTQARHYVNAALRFDPTDGGLWAISGRLHLRNEDLDAAENAFHEAASRGLAAARVLPWLAEIAYLQRDFARVRHILGQEPQLRHTPSVSPLVQFWVAPA